MPTYDKEFVIRYVDGELDDTERRQFEADLEKDPSLASEVALYRELRSVLVERLPQDDTAAALRERLAALNKEYFNPATPVRSIPMTRRIPVIRWAGRMAAAALLVVATLLLWPSDKKGLYQRLGDTQMVGLTERGGNADTLMQSAAGYFNNKEYAKALPLLDQAVKADSTNQLARFYRGVAALNTGAETAARSDLGQIYKSESLFRYEAAFYLALSYAQETNPAAAREWLNRIPADAPVYARAKELENSLK